MTTSLLDPHLYETAALRCSLAQRGGLGERGGLGPQPCPFRLLWARR